MGPECDLRKILPASNWTRLVVCCKLMPCCGPTTVVVEFHQSRRKSPVPGPVLHIPHRGRQGVAGGPLPRCEGPTGKGRVMLAGSWSGVEWPCSVDGVDPTVPSCKSSMGLCEGEWCTTGMGTHVVSPC